MKKIIAGFFIAALIFSVVPAYAGDKGASMTAQEHASEHSIFNRVGDWFATVGKSGAEKDQILAERRAERKKAEAEKLAKQNKAEAEKMAKKKKAEADKKMKEAKSKMGY